MYVPSIISVIVLDHSKICGRIACSFFPSGMMFFYLVVIRGWNFTSSISLLYYLRFQSINTKMYIEHCHVNRRNSMSKSTRFSLNLETEQAE